MRNRNGAWSAFRLRIHKQFSEAQQRGANALLLLAAVLGTIPACSTKRSSVPTMAPTATRSVEFVTEAGAMPAHLHATVELTSSRIRITLDSGWIVPRGPAWRDSLLVRVNLTQSNMLGETFGHAMLAPWDGRVESRAVARGDSVRHMQPVAFDFPWPCDRDLTRLWPTLQVRWGRGWSYAPAPKALLDELSRELQSGGAPQGTTCQ